MQAQQNSPAAWAPVGCALTVWVLSFCLALAGAPSSGWAQSNVDPGGNSPISPDQGTSSSSSDSTQGTKSETKLPGDAGTKGNQSVRNPSYGDHPWLASAPDGLKQLSQMGRVQIGIDDDRLRRTRKHAMTLFRIRADFRYQYTQSSPSIDPEDESQLQCMVDAKIRVPEVVLEHDIVFRSGFEPHTPWSDPLVLHEFDHVSISTDPRLRKLLKKVLNERIRCTVRWPRSEALTHARVHEAINVEMNAQIKELERLVQTQYDALDRVSRDGRVGIENREPFFLSLYTLEAMRECGFLYLDTVKSLAQDRPSKEVRGHYALLTAP
jgi:hypothetical protein